MTDQTVSTAPAGTLAAVRGQIDRFFAGIGQGVNAYIEAQSRLPQIARLNAKSDEQLAAMGLSREQIPQYVFRDLFYL